MWNKRTTLHSETSRPFCCASPAGSSAGMTATHRLPVNKSHHDNLIIRLLESHVTTHQGRMSPQTLFYRLLLILSQIIKTTSVINCCHKIVSPSDQGRETHPQKSRTTFMIAIFVPPSLSFSCSLSLSLSDNQYRIIFSI